MPKINFNIHRVNPRKDILHFVEENLDPKVYDKLAKEPQRWIDELGIIYGMITGHGMSSSTGIDLPPEGDKDFQKLGDDIFLYRGSNRRLRGVWLYQRLKDIYLGEDCKGLQWVHYSMGSSGTLRINAEFGGIPFETFLPENFEQRSTVIKDDKRKIMTFDVKNNGEDVTVYAKGSFVSTSHYYQPPSYRLTNLSDVIKITSEEEMNRIVKLAEHGVKVPKVVGYYETPLEEFLFLQKVGGGNPSNFLGSHRRDIIKQDAKMLGVLCLLGYRKVGFEDFEDKVFDGKHLYLVDTEEFEDLYKFMEPDFRSMLLNPLDARELRRFRDEQKSRFKIALRDAIFRYRNNLTPSLEDQLLYTKIFYECVGWGIPKESDTRKILNFPKNYMTLDSYICMMTEE